MLAAALTALAGDGQFFAYTGSYTRPNKSKGIYAYKFDSRAGKFAPLGLAAEISNPAFLAAHPDGRFLYAVSENGQGMVTAFAVQPDGKLKALNSVSSGNGPCHLALDKTGKLLFVANYGSGSVASFVVRPDGSLSEAAGTALHSGSSVNQARQSSPHAHQAAVSPDNRLLFVPDLGIDKVMIYRFNETGAITKNDPASIAIAPGSGPRHMAFSPDGRFIYVLAELTDSVIAFSHDGKGGTSLIQTIPAAPADFAGQKSGAEIAVHPNGKFLYASNRNHNSISIFTIGAKGILTAAGNVPAQGKTPRHFIIDPSGAYLIVSNQDSDSFVEFKIDPKTGGLTPAGEAMEAATPVSMAFVPVR